MAPDMADKADKKETRPGSGVSRRDFLRGGAAGALALAEEDRHAGVKPVGVLQPPRDVAAVIEIDGETGMAQLVRQIELSRDDAVTLERLAREHLGMTFPDDIILVLPESLIANEQITNEPVTNEPRHSDEGR